LRIAVGLGPPRGEAQRIRRGVARRESLLLGIPRADLDVPIGEHLAMQFRREARLDEPPRRAPGERRIAQISRRRHGRGVDGRLQLVLHAVGAAHVDRQGTHRGGHREPCSGDRHNRSAAVGEETAYPAPNTRHS